MKRLFVTTAAVAAAVALGACSSKTASKGNFKTAIQAYLDTAPAACIGMPMGTTPFKVAKGTGADPTYARASALAEAGLLSARDVEMPAGMFTGRAGPGQEFDLTDEGRKYLSRDRRNVLCTGTFKVEEVLNFTEPSEMMGAKVSRANYRYSLDDAAPWATRPAMVAAFPELKKYTEGERTQMAVLVSTSEGWMHERLFRKGSE